MRSLAVQCLPPAVLAVVAWMNGPCCKMPDIIIIIIFKFKT
jgi:hypothetical protein